MVAIDSPEVLARFHAEADLIDLLARQLWVRFSRRVMRTVTRDDLRSFGQEGLLLAARSYDETVGVSFRRWANVRVKGAMIDGVRRWGALPRGLYSELRAMEAGDELLELYDQEDSANPARTSEAADERLTEFLSGMATAMVVGMAVGVPRESVNDAGEALTPEDRFAQAELIARVKAIVAQLEDPDRTLIERRYFDDQTLEEASASVGLSKSWGSRCHARAIESITKALRRSGDG